MATSSSFDLVVDFTLTGEMVGIQPDPTLEDHTMMTKTKESSLQKQLKPLKSTYVQLKEKCLPLIEHYEADLLKCDFEWLKANPGIPFLHWTRDMGTYILFLHPADADFYPQWGEKRRFLFGERGRMGFLDSIVECADCYERDKTLLRLYFDGKKFREVTQKKAMEIAKDHHRKIKQEWGVK